MIALAVDDEQLVLNNLISALDKSNFFEKIISFCEPKLALDWLKENRVDMAFLDIDMPQVNGLSLAKQVKEFCPQCAIVFVTAHSHYAVDAFRLRASGYLLKPVSAQDILRELEFAKSEKPILKPEGMRIQCFGNFEVFYGAEPLKFRFAKTKELLAYLVDRKGALCDINSLCALLWEDKPDGKSLKSHLRHLIHDLTQAFQEIEKEGCIIKRRGMIGIVPDQIECDYYHWLEGDMSAVNQYAGEYMSQYSWAEMTAGGLIKRI